MSFSTLGLSAPILRAVTQQGYTTPTPIQLQAIPAIIQGRDIRAAAQTGTGKTAGFTLPILEHLLKNPTQGRRYPRILIMTPTRELAAQVEESVRTYGQCVQNRTAVIFGGVGIGPQITTLRQGVDIVVATPGRLLDHINQKTIDISKIEILVLDEADRMLDMGFINDIRRIIGILPKQRQSLLFSATFTPEITRLAETLLNDPVHIEVAKRNTAAENVQQVVHFVDRERKRELLSKIIKENNWKQVLVFTRTKHGANRLADQLSKDGIGADAIHGNKSQNARTKALSDFKKGAVRVLVATDIAARGLDIDELPQVVNFELPNVPEDYVHRIGRTGRAGNNGGACSLVCIDEHDLLKGIERMLKTEIRKISVEGFTPDPSITAEPIQNGRGSKGKTTASRAPRNSTQQPAAPSKGRSRTSTHTAAKATAFPKAAPLSRGGEETNERTSRSTPAKRHSMVNVGNARAERPKNRTHDYRSSEWRS